jgi:hypothetical protein
MTAYKANATSDIALSSIIAVCSSHRIPEILTSTGTLWSNHSIDHGVTILHVALAWLRSLMSLVRAIASASDAQGTAIQNGNCQHHRDRVEDIQRPLMYHQITISSHMILDHSYKVSIGLPLVLKR